MVPPIRRITTKFALLLAVAAVVPLLLYGFISIWSLREGTRVSVVSGNLNVATRAADEIGRYVTMNAELLKALSADLQNTGLEQWQQDRVLKNYILQFREFREITLFDEAGAPIATSRVGRPRVAVPHDAPTTISGVSMSAIHVDEDLLPTAIFAIHLTRLNQPAGWLVGEFSLEQMWRMVDQIRIGAHGFAMVIAPDGALVAHGDPDRKVLIARAQHMGDHPLLRAALAGVQPLSSEYADASGHKTLGVGVCIPSLRWTVIVEQPSDEALATATRLTRLLTFFISLALLTMVLVGYQLGRTFITPILRLRSGTEAIAAGVLDTRVDIRTGDEFESLGHAFNTMADRLAQLQEAIKRQERQAMFGRIAAGLVHDLSHPIQNIGNSARLLLRDDVDPESRGLFRRTIERELTTLKRFMEDLQNLVKPRPIERFPLDVNGSIADVLDALRAEGERAGVAVVAALDTQPLTIDGDRFALGRVYRNLITNAIQATEPDGSVTISTERIGAQVQVRVADTGSGIPADRLAAIFDDFMTTKRRGLGLGLSISKRIIEQLDGTITVESEVGRGTTFTLRFPAREIQPAQAAS